jgi:5-formyltetrahydrofolate cyclo-ligase
VRLALPVVIGEAQPLVFREWRPGTRMEPGVLDIPVPAEGAVVVPDILLVPLLGFNLLRPTVERDTPQGDGIRAWGA